MKLCNVIFLLVVSLFLFATYQYADTDMAGSSPSGTMATSDAVMKPINYMLPYPGILPDNPLYKIKVLRDKLIAWMISDPQKKAEFYLLQADKQMAMVAALLTKKEYDLAAVTALKAENNYTLLTYVYKNNTMQPNGGFYKKLQEAAIKHQEILDQAIKIANGNNKKTFQDVLYFSKTNWSEIQNLTDQNIMK